jgi:hypothetical protein
MYDMNMYIKYSVHERERDIHVYIMLTLYMPLESENDDFSRSGLCNLWSQNLFMLHTQNINLGLFMCLCN